MTTWYIYESCAEIIRRTLPAARLYVSSTGLLLAGIIFQSAGFIILAHSLGTVQFGELMTATAAANVAGTWCGFCPGEVLRRTVSRDPSSYQSALGHGLILISSTGAVLTAIVVFGLMALPFGAADLWRNPMTLLLLVASNLVLSSFVTFVEQIFLAQGATTRANILNAGFSMVRGLMPMVACLQYDVSSLNGWAIWHASAYLATSVICAVAVRRYGAPRWGIISKEMVLGVNLALSGFLIMLRGNVDLLILQATAAPHFVGVYSAARRIITTAFVIPGSFDRLAYGKLAVAGTHGPAGSFRLAKKYLIYVVLISSATSLAVDIFAPYVPWLLGVAFNDATPILKALCWTIIVTAIQFLGFDALNAAEQHKISAVVSGSSNIIGVVMIVAFVYFYGTFGIYFGLYLSDIIRAAALWLTLFMLSRPSFGSIGSAWCVGNVWPRRR